MNWTTLDMQVTTPLFNGGADTGPADPDGTGVRAASIRGAMRFWFRALAGALTGPNLPLLGAMERTVFGGVRSGDNGNGTVASPLLLRIADQPPVTKVSDPPFMIRENGKWIAYLIGPGFTKYNRDRKRLELTRPFVAAGEEFTLKIGFRHPRQSLLEERRAVEGLAFASLWLTCTYGGVGARTRRGFGGLRIRDASGPGSLPAPWNDGDALRTPGTSYYDKLNRLWIEGPLSTCVPYLQTLASGGSLSPRAWDRTPSFPVLSRTYAPAGVLGTPDDSFDTWENTLIGGGLELRYFRAAEPNNSRDARYDPLIETPEWINTIHGERKNQFPVGALGLPVVMKDGYEVHADPVSGGEAKGRRASPLWIRAVGSDGDWRLLTFALQAEFLPAGVHLWERGRRQRPLQITDDDVTRQTSQWIQVMRDEGSFLPEDGVRAEKRDTGGL